MGNRRAACKRVVSSEGLNAASDGAFAKNVRTQDGKIKTVGEFVAPHLPAYELAGEVVRNLVAPQTHGQRRKIVAVYLDPANFKNIGDGHTIADQINEVIEPYDLGAIPASNDRLGGWQRMYQMLQTGQWQIADTCPKLQILGHHFLPSHYLSLHLHPANWKDWKTGASCHGGDFKAERHTFRFP